MEMNDCSGDTAVNASELEDIPNGYFCKKDGVFQTTTDDEVQLTFKPIWVEALSRDGARENWGRLLCWQDHDNEYHQRAIKAGRMHSRGNELAQELADAGLPVIPGKEMALLRYLAAFHPDARLIAATSTGWTEEAFVLPKQIVGEPEGDRIVFQPVAYHAAADAIYAQGSHGDWCRHIAEPASDNPLLRFAISTSLAAPLRHLSNIEAGGFHYYARTSLGKTTLLQTSASVWGNGSDPNQVGGDNVYLQRWNATRNGMEGIAEAYNDLPLIIDEIGEGDGHNFGKMIYQLMGGTGRARADRTGAARQRRHWRAWVISAGEVPVSTYIDESGQKVRGGQLVRLIDIPAESIFPDAAAADHMKDACSRYFGTAGPAFVKKIIDDGIDTVREELKQIDAVAEQIGSADTKEVRRVRKRFTLIAVAGEMAIRMDIVPWTEGAALDACRSVFELWRKDSTAIPDVERGINNVRDYILRHGASRFEQDGNSLPVRDRAGWYRDDRYHFTPKAFAEACDGVLPKVVKRALKERGLLYVSDPDRLRSGISVGGQAVHVVSVSSAVLGEDVPIEPTAINGMGGA